MPNIEETLPSAEDPTRASAVRKALWKLLPS